MNWVSKQILTIHDIESRWFCIMEMQLITIIIFQILYASQNTGERASS
jgi:hypothetical protein